LDVKALILGLIFCWSLGAARSVSAQSQKLDSLAVFVAGYQREDTVKVNALNALSKKYQWTNFYSSLEFAQQAQKIAEQLNYTKGIATAKYLKGHCYWALGDSEIAIEMGLNAVQLAQQEKLESVLAEGYQVLARSYMDQASTDKAIFYINQAEAIALKNKNWDQVSRVYNLAGVFQFVNSHIDSALLLYQRALNISEQHGTPKLHSARILSNIGECHLKTNPKLAFTFFDRALSVARETENRAAEAGISAIVGHALIRRGDYVQAGVYLNSALALSRELGLKRVTRHAYGGLSDLMAKKGKTAEALAYMKSFYEVRDSLLNASKTRQIVEMEARHELEKKEQAIKLLEQEKEIQEIWRNILIAALILAGVAAVVIYYLRAYRENKNREILNLEIDYLTAQHKELSENNKNLMLKGNEKAIESQDQRLLKAAIEVVEKNMKDPLFGVEKMAKELGMSRTNMHRRVKAITGFPPSELIRSIRLRRAAVLLLNQADSVSQIGLMVGFEDHSYFSKSFKKQFGVPPSEYLSSVNQAEQLVES
jgi:AraC-like DNA-binding protein